MKVMIHFKKYGVKSSNHKLFLKFISFLQSNLPLENNLSILFISEREGKMTTGSRTDNNELYILSKNRLIRDIFRTLAHEWVHEYQMTILGREKGSAIGGRNEDEANAYAGRLVKMFEKEYPNIENKMYE